MRGALRVRCKQCGTWVPEDEARSADRLLDGGTRPGDRVLRTHLCRACDAKGSEGDD